MTKLGAIREIKRKNGKEKVFDSTKMGKRKTDREYDRKIYRKDNREIDREYDR